MFKCCGRYVTSVTELAFVISTFKKKSLGEIYISYVFIPLEDFFLIQVFAALHIFEV